MIRLKLLKRAILNDVPILSFMEHVTNLEDVFMEITKGDDDLKMNFNNPVLFKELK